MITPPPLPIARQKQIDLAASGGAALLGLGLGVLLAGLLRPVAIALVAIGAVLHAWSMLVRHRVERAAGVELPGWARVLYWSCWLGLAAIVLRLLLTSLR